MAKILLVDDDEDQNEMLAAFMSQEKHVIDTATSIDDAKHLLTISAYDVIVLDRNLPDGEGLELCRWYRSRGKAPVIMLTGKTSIDDRTAGLDAGADDYLVKPFDARELAARIRALLRRPQNFGDTTLNAGGYTLNRSTLSVTKGDVELRLPPREFAIIEFLARHPNEIFSGNTLMVRIWSAESEATTDSLRTAIKKIRKTLNNDTIIEYVAGAGYKLG